jgi:hypothetical protein
MKKVFDMQKFILWVEETNKLLACLAESGEKKFIYCEKAELVLLRAKIETMRDAADYLSDALALCIKLRKDEIQNLLGLFSLEVKSILK